MDKNKWSYSYSWTQPYTVSMNPLYQHNVDLAHELRVLEDIDRAVEAMDTYPDALAIIQKVRNGL
jgi:hypothetical protein